MKIKELVEAIEVEYIKEYGNKFTHNDFWNWYESKNFSISKKTFARYSSLQRYTETVREYYTTDQLLNKLNAGHHYADNERYTIADDGRIVRTYYITYMTFFRI